MIKRGQVFFRALDSNGKMMNCDVLDLDDESFRRCIATLFCKMEMLTFIKSDDETHLPLKAKAGIVREED